MSKHTQPCEDPFWKECKAAFAAKKDQLDKGLCQHSDVAMKAAKRFKRNLPAI